MAKYQPDSTLREMQWKLPRGPWYARFSRTVKDPKAEGGTRRLWVEESTGYRNKVEARKRVLEILSKHGSESATGEKKVLRTFHEGAIEYQRTRQDAAEATRNSIGNSIELHLGPFFGKYLLDDITLGTFKDFVRERRSNDPDCALYNDWKTFTGIMNLMHAQGHRRLELKVPNPDGERAERRRQEKRVLSPQELVKLFISTNPTTQLQMALGHDMFLRPPKEICRIRYADIDFTVRELNLGGRRVKHWGHITVFNSKKKTLKRRVPMTEEIRTALLRRKNAHDKRCLRRYGVKPVYVFYSRGNPEKPALTFIGAFRRAVRRAGIPRCTPYILRRTGLTAAYRNCIIAAGMEGTKQIPTDAVKLSIVAGHRIDTAIKDYLGFDPQDLSDVLTYAGGAGGKLLGTTYVGSCRKVMLTERAAP